MITDTIIGHKKQRQFLLNSIKAKRVAHAYLFTGEEALGKKTVALQFAQIINCQLLDIDKRPCGKCLSCEQFNKAYIPDLFFIQPEKQEIKIGQIKDLIEKINLKSYILEYKIVIIDQAEKMNQEAADALLKILEEPPKNSIFILISSYLYLLPPTIISRTQIIDFFLLSQEEIRALIIANKKRYKISSQDINDIIFFSHLKPGKALYFLHNKRKLIEIKENFKKIEQGSFFDLSYGFEYIKKITSGENSNEIEQFLNNLLLYFRLVLKKKDKKNLAKYNLKEITGIIDYIQKIDYLIKFTNINNRLALENLIFLLAVDKMNNKL